MNDSESLLESPLIRAVLRPGELKRARVNEDWLSNAIAQDGDTVLTVGSDSSMPGGCGVMWICEWRGLYFFESSDEDPEGPFASLEEALQLDQFSIFTSSNEIDSTAIAPEKLLQMVFERFSDDDGDTIAVGGSTYVMAPEGLMRVDDTGSAGEHD